MEGGELDGEFVSESSSYSTSKRTCEEELCNESHRTDRILFFCTFFLSAISLLVMELIDIQIAIFVCENLQFIWNTYQNSYQYFDLWPEYYKLELIHKT